MNEDPKNIWKKSGKGAGWFRAWLIVLAATFFIVLFVTLLIPGGPRSLLDWLPAVVFLLVVSLVIATVLVGLWAFIRWLNCWRNFKRFLFGLACFVTLIALFYAEEDWRGKHDWENFKREWEAKGEKFDFKNFVPPPVSDDQNFAIAPVFDTTDKLSSRKWRQEHRNPHLGIGGDQREWDTNLVDRLAMIFVNYEDLPTNGTGNCLMAKTSDLRAWQMYYRALAIKTNEFPVPPEPRSPAQDVLLALSKFAPAIEELRAASRRPESRFPLDYDDADTGEILLPHFATLKRCSQVLQLRALAELQAGESDKALADVKLALRLAEAIHSEPFIISQLVRMAILHLTMQPIYEGLAGHKWSDAQLTELDAELAKLDFLADYEFSVRGERAAHIKVIAWLAQKRSRCGEFFSLMGGDTGNLRDMMTMYLMPKGWFYQNDIVLAQMHQQWNLPMVDATQQTISPEMAKKNIPEWSGHPTPFNFFARLLAPALGSYAQKTAYAQNAVNLARVAIALERYRLAHGDHPESLDALTPQFIAKLPHDIINGQPLHYRRAGDGQFILYSVGWNETDDGGEVGLKKDGAVDINKGDWVWRYPAK